MRLDHNCVRDVMLFLESQPFTICNDSGRIEHTEVWLDDICDTLSAYPSNELFYTLEKLHEGGYIDISFSWSNNELNDCWVNSITYAGHEFLDTIRANPVWKKTLSIAGEVGNFSLKMLSSIAEGVATAAVSARIAGGN